MVNATIFEAYPDEKKILKDMLKTNNEVELIFPNPSYSNYIRLLNFFNESKGELLHEEYLDVIMKTDDFDLRLSMFDQDEIDKLIDNYSRSSYQQIVSFLSKLQPNENRKLIRKFNQTALRKDLPDYGVRLKMAEESEAKQSDFTKVKRISYRYKDRLSIIFKDHRIDISAVSFSNNLSDVAETYPRYEVELEITDHKMNIDKIDEIATKILALIQNSDLVLSKSETNEVIKSYQNLFDIQNTMTVLNARSVISLETIHVRKFLPNNYAVTDKPDGERMFLYHCEKGVYLITMNVQLRKMDIKYNPKLGVAVLDGELIDIDNKRIFTVFDVVYANGIDYRRSIRDQDHFLEERLNIVKHITNKYFGFDIEIKKFNGKDLELDLMLKFYEKEVPAYWKTFHKYIKDKDNSLIITAKQYLVPFGIDSSEIFMLTYLLWRMNLQDIYPYTLDGLILTPLNQPYEIKGGEQLDVVPQEYKMKPPEFNTIDFYLLLDRNDQGEIERYRDDRRKTEQYYLIGHLMLGQTFRDGDRIREKPVPFRANGRDQLVYLFFDENREITDLHGSIIEDKTVIEVSFDYNNFNGDADEMPYRWIVHRTRYDKTESVHLHQRRYGNTLFTGTRIWKSITNPVTFEIFKSLADPETYQSTMNMIGTKMVEGGYYQKKTNLGIGIRAFNNRLKRNLIRTYTNGKKKILDMACGKAGDLPKMAGLGLELYVGVDVDRSGLFLQKDSALNRYFEMRNQLEIPFCQFILADLKMPLNEKAQRKILPTADESNFGRMNKYLSQPFDVINCQFAIHYFLESEEIWNNFCNTINEKLNDNGYFIVTALDGDLVASKLENKDKYGANYTANNGEKHTFFEIVKLYKKYENYGTAIDLYNAMINQPGTYFTEYLVKPSFLIKSLEKKCGLKLVESDLFLNYYLIHKQLFLSKVAIPNENEIRQFYRSLDPKYQETLDTETIEKNEAGFKFTMMNRYYVFKKVGTQQKRIVGINGKLSLGNTLHHYFISNNLYVEPTGNENLRDLYQDMMGGSNIVPDVYVIKQVSDDEINFTNKKQGNGEYMLLFYRKDSMFYPIFIRSELKYSNNPYKVEEPKRKYFIKMGNIKKDLAMLLN